MSWTEGVIAAAVARQVLQRRCVLLVDRCQWTGHECDVLGVTTDLRIIDVEIKISRSDLRADRDKGKWWRSWPSVWNPAAQRYECRSKDPLEWPAKVWKHYFALPADIWTDELLDCLPSPASGVILLRRAEKWRGALGIDVATVARRAKPCRDATRLKPEQVMDIARLANLRMWNAYDERDSARAERDRLYAELRSAKVAA